MKRQLLIAIVVNLLISFLRKTINSFLAVTDVHFQNPKLLLLKIAILSLCLFQLSCQFKNNGEDKILPDFDLLMVDSTTIFNTSKIQKGAPFVLVYFSPDCEHCQQETDTLLKNMNDFKNICFYYITNDPLDRLRVFNSHYRLNNYPNIVLGRDTSFFFIRNFKPIGTPYMIVYDKLKKMRAVFSGIASSRQMADILAEL